MRSVIQEERGAIYVPKYRMKVSSIKYLLAPEARDYYLPT